MTKDARRLYVIKELGKQSKVLDEALDMAVREIIILQTALNCYNKEEIIKSFEETKKGYINVARRFVEENSK